MANQRKTAEDWLPCVDKWNCLQHMAI